MDLDRKNKTAVADVGYPIQEVISTWRRGLPLPSNIRPRALDCHVNALLKNSGLIFGEYHHYPSPERPQHCDHIRFLSKAMLCHSLLASKRIMHEERLNYACNRTLTEILQIIQ